MGVSADLCDQSAGGQSGQISGHKSDISQKKTEGRGGHALNVDRNESGDPTAIGSYDQFNRIKAPAVTVPFSKSGTTRDLTAASAITPNFIRARNFPAERL